MEIGGFMRLNDRPYPQWKEGMTIQDVIIERNFIYPKLVIKLNDKLIEKPDYTKIKVQEKDDLKIHHLLAGG